MNVFSNEELSTDLKLPIETGMEEITAVVMQEKEV